MKHMALNELHLQTIKKGLKYLPIVNICSLCILNDPTLPFPVNLKHANGVLHFVQYMVLTIGFVSGKWGSMYIASLSWPPMFLTHFGVLPSCREKAGNEMWQLGGTHPIPAILGQWCQCSWYDFDVVLEKPNLKPFCSHSCPKLFLS